MLQINPLPHKINQSKAYSHNSLSGVYKNYLRQKNYLHQKILGRLYDIEKGSTLVPGYKCKC